LEEGGASKARLVPRPEASQQSPASSISATTTRPTRPSKIFSSAAQCPLYPPPITSSRSFHFHEHLTSRAHSVVPLALHCNTRTVLSKVAVAVAVAAVAAVDVGGGVVGGGRAHERCYVALGSGTAGKSRLRPPPWVSVSHSEWASSDIPLRTVRVAEGP
jgi:hypothetical protein